MTSKDIQRYNKKSVPQLIKIATVHFNKFIRERDKDKPCISCGKFKSLQAGHYLSAGHHANLRFNELNTNGQCAGCNLFLSGNLINYRINLVKKIGLEKVEFLESQRNNSHKWDRFTLINLILKYK